MKIYKKILNFGYGLMCLVPFIVLAFVFLYCVKGVEGGNGLFADFDTLVNKFTADAFKDFANKFVSCVDWFPAFKSFNSWFANIFSGSTSFGSVINFAPILATLILYAEWVVLVSFFRLFGSVFGCMINFADRMLDKIGGTN